MSDVHIIYCQLYLLITVAALLLARYVYPLCHLAPVLRGEHLENYYFSCAWE